MSVVAGVDQYCDLLSSRCIDISTEKGIINVILLQGVACYCYAYALLGYSRY